MLEKVELSFANRRRGNNYSAQQRLRVLEAVHRLKEQGIGPSPGFKQIDICRST